MLAVVLVLALCQMDGILLTGVLHLVGGLIGWGTQMFWVALCVGGMFALCDLQPVRLRVTSILLFPVLSDGCNLFFFTSSVSPIGSFT